MESTTPVVLGEGLGVAVAEVEAGVAFPFVAKPVDLFGLGGTVLVDQMGEHSSASH
jgi:hypothetical protein